MTAVTVPPSTFDAERPYTVADLKRMPDDGRRRELLDAMCPTDMHVLPAPYAVRTSPENEPQPDLLVARDDDVTERLLPVAPALAVEVLSPSTALNDLNNKKAAYQRMGTPSYWVVDTEEPRLTVFELDDRGQYQQVADVKGEDAFEARQPFPVWVVPSELLGTLRGRFG